VKILDLKSVARENIIKESVDILKSGGMIVYPTETCYGLGVDGTNQEAVDTLLKFKKRPQGKAISIAVSDLEMVEKWVEINNEAKKIYETFLPGPVTVISKVKKMSKLAVGLASEKGTLGIRISSYSLVNEIVKKLNLPITATSANVASLSSPYSLDQWQKQTSAKSQALVALFIDGGKLPRRQPSTVVDTTVENLQVIRGGEIKITNLRGEFVSKTVEETEMIASSWLKEYELKKEGKPLVFALIGDMGSGKTQFARGVARKLEVREILQSPTFTILDEYRYKKGYFVHMDAWRLEEEYELINLKLENYLQEEDVWVIEWADKIQNYLKKLEELQQIQLVWIRIETIGKERRKIEKLEIK